jgi:hypothetical protein
MREQVAGACVLPTIDYRGRDPDVNAYLEDRGFPTAPVAGAASVTN